MNQIKLQLSRCSYMCNKINCSIYCTCVDICNKINCNNLAGSCRTIATRTKIGKLQITHYVNISVIMMRQIK